MKAKPVCKVTFKINKEIGKPSDKAFLVGDFNDWSKSSTPMKKLKSGEFSVTVDLEKGRDYEFKYLLDADAWENDWEADAYRTSDVGENSVVEC